MILVNSETKKPCNCKDCITVEELKRKLKNAEWTKKVSIDSIQPVEYWWQRV